MEPSISNASTSLELDVDVGPVNMLDNLESNYCGNCERLQSEMKKLKEDHAVNFQVLKEKIIPTDSLIKKHVSKCQAYDNLVQKFDDAKKKLDGMKRECELLEGQLKTALQENEPLKNSTSHLEKVNVRLENEAQVMKDKLNASECLIKQYKDTVRELQEEERQDVQRQKKMKALEDSYKKMETTVSKLKAESLAKSQTVTELKRSNRSLESQLLKAQTMLKDMEIRLQEKDLLPWKRKKSLKFTYQCGVNEETDEDVQYMTGNDSSCDDVDTDSCFSLSLGAPLYPALSPIPGSPRRKDHNSGGDTSGSEGQFSDAESLGDMADKLENELSSTQTPAVPPCLSKQFPLTPLKTLSPKSAKTNVQRSPGGLRLLPLKSGGNKTPRTKPLQKQPKSKTAAVHNLTFADHEMKTEQQPVGSGGDEADGWVPAIGQLSETESENEQDLSPEGILSANQSCGFSLKWTDPIGKSNMEVEADDVAEKGDAVEGGDVVKDGDVLEMGGVMEMGDVVERGDVVEASDIKEKGDVVTVSSKTLSEPPVDNRKVEMEKERLDSESVIEGELLKTEQFMSRRIKSKLKRSVSDSESFVNDTPPRKVRRSSTRSEGAEPTKRITRSQVLCCDNVEVLKEHTIPCRTSCELRRTPRARQLLGRSSGTPRITRMVTRSLSSPGAVSSPCGNIVKAHNAADEKRKRFHALYKKSDLTEPSETRDSYSENVSVKSSASDIPLVRRQSEGFLVNSSFSETEGQDPPVAEADVSRNIDQNIDESDEQVIENTNCNVDNVIGTRRMTRLQARTLQEGVRKSKSPNRACSVSQASPAELSHSETEEHRNSADSNVVSQSSGHVVTLDPPNSPMSSRNGSQEVTSFMKVDDRIPSGSQESQRKDSGDMVSLSPIGHIEPKAMSPLPETPPNAMEEAVSPLPTTPCQSETELFSVGLLNPLLSPLRDSAKLWPVVSPLPPSPVPRAISPMSSTASTATPVHPSPHVSFHSTAPSGVVTVKPKPIAAQRNLSHFDRQAESSSEVLQNVTRGNLSSQAAALQILRNQCHVTEHSGGAIVHKRTRKVSGKAKTAHSATSVAHKSVESQPERESKMKKCIPSAKEKVESIVFLDKQKSKGRELVGWMAAVTNKRPKRADKQTCAELTIAKQTSEMSSAFTSYNRQDNVQSQTGIAKTVGDEVSKECTSTTSVGLKSNVSQTPRIIHTRSQSSKSRGKSKMLDAPNVRKTSNVLHDGSALMDYSDLMDDASSVTSQRSNTLEFKEERKVNKDAKGRKQKDTNPTKPVPAVKSHRKVRKNQVKVIQNWLHHMMRSKAITVSDTASKCSDYDPPVLIKVILKLLYMCKVDMTPAITSSLKSGGVNWRPVLNPDECSLVEWAVCLVKQFNLVKLTEEIDKALLENISMTDRPLFGRMAICRFYIAFCQALALLDKVHQFLYNLFSLKSVDIVNIMMTVASVWPQALLRKICIGGADCAFIEVTEYIMFKKLKLAKNRKARSVLEQLCGFQDRPLDVTVYVQAVFDRIKKGQMRDRQCFDELKAIDLLSIYEEWDWAYKNLVLGQCLPALSEWKKKNVSHEFMLFVTRLSGQLCSRCPLDQSNLIFPIVNLMKTILAEKGSYQALLDLQYCTVESFISLAKYNPHLVLPPIDEWVNRQTTALPQALCHQLEVFWNRFRNKDAKTAASLATAKKTAKTQKK